MWILLLLLCAGHACTAYPSVSDKPLDATQTDQTDSVRDDAVSRKVLGSSVVTSVSVIMDTGSEKHYADAVGKPQAKPTSGAQVASPINLLNPDRYEFYTFNDAGDLVKRLMTLSEIQGIIANADGDAFNHNSHNPEKKVNDVVSNVQNVLKSEIEKGLHGNQPNNIILDTPDVSSSWSVILPAIFGNSGEEIKPAKPQTSMTPDTIMLEHQTVPVFKKPEGFVKPTTEKVATKRPTTGSKTTTTEKEIVKKPSTYRPSTYVAPSSTLKPPTTTKKPIRPSTKKSVTRTTTPTTAIPRITTRGTRPNRRPTTTTTTTTTKAPEVVERVKPTTTSPYTSFNEGSSHFIQLFDPLQSAQTQSHYTRVPIINTTPRTPISASTSASHHQSATTTHTYVKPSTLGTYIRPSGGALFIVDEKTNTKIPITTKEQLATLLNKLESTTSSELFKNVSPSTIEKEPIIIFNSVSGHHTPDNTATTSNIQATTQTADETTDDRYQQLLLTSTNIYEINKELAKSTTTPKPVRRVSTVLPSTQKVSQTLSTTLKEPNLVNSIEQLIQQAVGNIQETQKTTMHRITQKPTSEATTTTSLVTTQKEDEITESPSTTTGLGGMSDDALLSEAMGSLFAQVASSDFQGLTTLQELPSTTEILNKPLNENLEYRIKTTDIFSESTDSTSNNNDATTVVPVLQEHNTNSQLVEQDATVKEDVEPTTESTLRHESEIRETTETDVNLKSTTTNVGTTNEILKTDATSYETGPLNSLHLKENLHSVTESLTSTTELPSQTEVATEVIKDLPIVFDLGLFHDFQDIDAASNFTDDEILSTTTEKLLDEGGTTEALTDRSTSKQQDVFTESAPILDSQTLPETTEYYQTTTSKDPVADSDSLPSTHSYKEVTNINSLPDTTTKDKEAASTLSIEQLLKELTTRKTSQNFPKETTVLIITKPVHSTTPSASHTPGTSIITEMPTTSVTPPILDRNKLVDSTEPIAADAISSNTESPDPTTTEESLSTTLFPAKEPEWTIVSTIAPHNATNTTVPEVNTTVPDIKLPQPPKPVDLVPMPQLSGLEETTKDLDQDIYHFVALCNELAFGFWKSVTTGISTARSVVLSPFAATSLLAMVFLGARGATSGEMNEILRLDDMVTFNPHLIFKNVSESIEVTRKGGVATSVIVRELYSDKAKGQLLNFYKERAKAFYDGHVEEVSFKEVGDVIRRRTNLIVKKQTGGKIGEYIKDSSITVKSPLAGVSASIFQTDCSDASTAGRDGELYFVVLPSIRQRRLVPVPAAVWRDNFLAGYEPALDATAVALGGKEQLVSTIFVIPGQQGIAAPGDGLARLERHLIGAAFKDKAWSRLLMTLIPRPGLEVQIPRFQHRSVINATVALQQMGMKDLFDATKADLRGLNGVANDLYLSDILQVNSFATCGEEPIAGESHHAEIYPATANRTYRRSRKFKDALPPEEAYYDSELAEEPRDYQRAFHDPLHDPSLYALPLPLRPRQARLPDPPRLRFDRPFLYFVRHNPTGLILHMGRFNPRLLP